jgi:hypothetical protein
MFFDSLRGSYRIECFQNARTYLFIAIPFRNLDVLDARLSESFFFDCIAARCST